MRNIKIGSILVGILLIGIGIGYGGDILNLWNFTLFFDGWWTLFIIVPFACSMLNNGYNTFSMIGLVVGVILLLSAQDIFTENIIKLAIPVILILVGLNLIFRNRFFNKAKIKNLKSQNSPEYGAYFSTQNLNYNELTFTGNNVNAVFGSLIMDLRGSFIQGDCLIELNSIFGTVEIIVPDNVIVKTQISPIFGGLKNKHKAVNNGDAEQITIYISGLCIFGGVEII